MENKNAHVEKMEKRIEKWSEELDAFVAHGDGVGAEARVEYIKRINDVKSRYRTVRERLDELRMADEGAWVTFKRGLESAWNDLEVAYKKLTT
jgi:hypothetical protein